MATRRTSWRRRVGLLVGATILALLGGEMGLRGLGMFPPRPRFFVGEREDSPSENFVLDSHTGWRMRASHEARVPREAGPDLVYRSNAQGFRSDRDFSMERAVARRIAIAGDSQSFGSGVPVERTYAAQLERLLGDTEGFNFAMPGFGVDQIWSSVRHQALAYRPDLVIVGLFYLDFSRSLTAFRVHEQRTKPLYRLEAGRLLECRDGDRPAAVLRILERCSHVWTAGLEAWQGLGRTHGVGHFWQLNRAFLEAIREDCRDAGVPVQFLYIPDRQGHPFPALREYFAQDRAAFLDLGDPLPTDVERLYQANGHLSIQGHRWVAEALAERIRERGL